MIRMKERIGIIIETISSEASHMPIAQTGR